jgi:hypothetical protein
MQVPEMRPVESREPDMMARGDARALRRALAAVSVLTSAACTQGCGVGARLLGSSVHDFAVSVRGLGEVDIPQMPPTCLTSCDHHDILDGTVINLAAVPGQGWHVSRWGGDCSGTSLTAAVTLTATRSCTAIFAPDVPVLLTIVVNGAGIGEVASQAYSLVQTSASTSVNLSQGYVIVLVEKPSPPSTFAGWEGRPGAGALRAPASWAMPRAAPDCTCPTPSRCRGSSRREGVG